MRRQSQGLVLALLGFLVLRVALTDLHLRYVQPYAQPLLVASGGLLVVAGLGTLVSLAAPRARRVGVVPVAETHDHPAPRSAWLLVVPLVVLAVVSPTALGSYAAGRLDTRVAAPTAQLAALSSSGGPVALGLVDFYQRAYYDPATVAGVRVRLGGFVSVRDGHWSVTQLLVSCCAADARPVKVEVEGVAAPPVNSWVTVDGVLAGRDGNVVMLAATSAAPAPTPRSPYVY